jgi:hypothetical protein
MVVASCHNKYYGTNFMSALPTSLLIAPESNLLELVRGLVRELFPNSFSISFSRAADWQNATLFHKSRNLRQSAVWEKNIGAVTPRDIPSVQTARASHLDAKSHAYASQGYGHGGHALYKREADAQYSDPAIGGYSVHGYPLADAYPAGTNGLVAHYNGNVTPRDTPPWWLPVLTTLLL